MANLSLVPTLEIQRELYRIPRGNLRFQRYLEVMLNSDRSDVDLPLPAFNPMGGDGVRDALDRLLTLDAEAIVESALPRLERRLDLKGRPQPPAEISLVLIDDIGGQWTHREIVESQIAGYHPSVKRSHLARIQTPVYLWASENYQTEQLEQALFSTIFRQSEILENGLPVSLRQVLIQEAKTRSFAGVARGNFSDSDTERIFSVIAPLLSTEDFPTIFSACYGDRIADSAGYAMLGLEERAGFSIPIDWLEREAPDEDRTLV